LSHLARALCAGRLLLVLLLAGVGAGSVVTSARAHAVLVAAEPADGGVLMTSPARLRLVFNEPVRIVFVHLIDAAGRQRLAADAARAVDAIVEAQPSSLEAGSYILSYRAVSADGHPIGGSVRFRIGAGEGAGAPGPESNGREAGWCAVSAVARFLRYAGLLATAGGALFLALVVRDRRQWHAPTRRYILVSLAGAALAGFLAIGVEGALLTLAPMPAGLVEPEAWSAGWDSAPGRSVVVSLLGLALLALTLRRRGTEPSRSLLVAGSLVAVSGLAFTGHAATAAPRQLAAPTVVLHGLVAAVWIGGLWPLLTVVRRGEKRQAVEILRRFSGIATVAVTLLALAGLVLATLQLAAPAALTGTLYGRILLAKLAAVLLLLALAALNRWRLTPALAGTGGRAAAAPLRASIIAELGLGLAVLAVTAALGTVPPPRTAAALPARAGETLTLRSGDRTARVEVSPARIGPNTVKVYFARDGMPFDPTDVTVELSLPAAGIEPLRGAAARTGPGEFALPDLTLAPAGTWELRIEALISDFERATFDSPLPVRGEGAGGGANVSK
jgi:copper transport protein